VVLTPAFSLDFIVGARGGYYVWKPYLQEMEGSGIEEIGDGTGVLYGPAISVIFNEAFTFSSTVLFGRQSTYWSNDDLEKEWGGTKISNGTFFAETNRIDVDSALSYRLSRLFKLFAGYKYQYTESYLKGTHLNEDPSTTEEQLWRTDAVVKITSHGPALGVGYSRPLGTSFFVSANVSGLYMFGKYDLPKDDETTYTADGVDQINFESVYDAGGFSWDTMNIGINVEPSVGMAVNNVVATLGGRFQWVTTRFTETPYWGTNNWMNDFLYGVFVGALYQF